MGVGSELYSGAAGLGKTMSWVSLIIGCIIALILVSVGSYFMFHNTDNNWATVNATVTSATCTPITNNGTTIYSCSLNVEYSTSDSKVLTGEENSNGKLSGQVILSNTNAYTTGDNVTIQYSLSNPTTIREPSDSKLAAWISYGTAIFIVLAVTLNWYLANHSKLYAAASGTSTVLNTVLGK